MEKVKVKKVNIISLIVILAFYAVYKILYLGNTFCFSDLNGFFNFVSFLSESFSIVLVWLVMSFEKNEELSFRLAVIGSGVLILLDPTIAFPALPFILGICISKRLFRPKFDVKKACAALYFYIAPLLIFIIEKKMYFFPLINVYTVGSFIRVYAAVVGSAVAVFIVFIILSKLENAKLSYVFYALWALYTFAAALYFYYRFNDMELQHGMVASVSGLIITVYNSAKSIQSKRSLTNGKQKAKQ